MKINHFDDLIQERELIVLGQQELTVYLSETIMAIGDKFLNPVCLTNIDQPDQPLFYVNKAFEDLTSYKNSELVGHNCRFLQGPRTDIQGIGRIKQAIKENEPICQDLVNYTRYGKIYINRLVLLPFKEKNVRYYIGVQTTIDEKRFKPKHDIERMYLQDRVLNPLTIIMGQHMMELPEMEKNLTATFVRLRSFVESL